MLKELGISAGSFILICFVLYWIIKWAVASGMSETNDLLKEMLESRQDESTNIFDNMKGKKCCIHLKSDSEYYFAMGEEFNAKISDAAGSRIELTDIEPTGSGEFSGKVVIKTTDISYAEILE